MEWATTIFSFEHRLERSNYVERIWRTRSAPDKAMLAVAVPHWEILVLKHANRMPSMILRGPQTKARVVGIPEAEEFVGIEFKLGTFLPAFAAATLVDGACELGSATGCHINFAKSNWEIPGFENAADFVARLVRKGELVRDPLVPQVLSRRPVALTDRSVQRRFLRATGLTCSTIRQIERAERTVASLTAGTPILDAVDMAGYSDQAHMTRSLQRFFGKTPAKLAPARR